MTEEKALAVRDMDFPAMINKFKGEIERALPKHLIADRMCRIALTEFRKNPKLAKCDPRSVFAAVIQSAQLGLEVGLMGEASLVPYKTECQLIPGYTGLMKLAMNTGKVRDIYAHEVRENDFFELTFGLQKTLKHVPMQRKGGFPATDEDRGEIVGYYAVGVLADETRTFQAMNIQDVEKIRDKSNGYKNAKKYGGQSTWIEYPVEMGKKTVIRRLCKYLPKSPELSAAISLDTVHEIGGNQSLTVDDVINGTWAPDYNEAQEAELLPDEPDHAALFAEFSKDFPQGDLAAFIKATASGNKTTEAEIKAQAVDHWDRFQKAFKKFQAKQAKAHENQKVFESIPKPEPVQEKPEAAEEKPPILCPATRYGVFPDECGKCDESKNPDGVCSAFQEWQFDQDQK